jgi:glycosyltransferase involved in cell wall biosynthesis
MAMRAMNFVSSQNAAAQAIPAEPRRRILHLHSGNLYGGVETLLHTLARLRHLNAGMEPHFGLCFEGRLSQELTQTGASVHLLGNVRISRPWTVWRARRRLSALLRSQAYDAVVCHMPWPLVVFGGTARAAGQKLVFWAHSGHTGRSWLERMAQRTEPDLAISNSRFIAETIASLYPNVSAPVIFYPVELRDSPEAPRWRTAVRRELGAADDEVVIVQVSRYEAWKGHLLHLQALERIKHQGKWVCWLVGGPQTESDHAHFDEVRRTAQRLGLETRVRFLGQRSDVPHLLAGADIFCQPNQGPEPFGIVFIEALWAGLPVVTTAMGGALEILDESCGFLTEPDNPVSLAESLERLIAWPDLRARLGKAGPARARLLCDPATQMHALSQALNKAITEGRSS